MYKREETKTVRFSLWIHLFFIAGAYFGALNLISMIQSHEPILIGKIVKLLVFLIPVTIVLMLRIRLTPTGHFSFFGITWNEKTIKIFYQTPLRKWKDCLIKVELGWPFFPINIRETEAHFPLLIKYFTSDYKQACLYLFEYGRAAKIDEKTSVYLKKMAERNKSNLPSGWRSGNDK